MEIPYTELSAETLEAVIEDFVTREGTDYGQQEYSLQSKIEQVKGQLQRGEVKITFDPESETCSLIHTRELI
jgi:uncharacterized protein YheU (UPF0270 family)